MQGMPQVATRGYVAGTSNPVFFNANAGAYGATDPTHTYVQAEPLRKMWQMSSTTSNTFLVIMTVGFFEVRQDALTGQHLFPQADGSNRFYLGKEMYQTVPGDLRQKFVSIIDRSYIGLDSTLPEPPTPLQTAEKPWFNTILDDVKPGDTTVRMYCADNQVGPPAVQRGQIFVDGSPVFMTTASRGTIRLGFGDNATNQADGESVTLTPVPTAWANGIGTFTITSAVRYHTAGSPVSNVLLGNPGPQPNFDYRDPRYSNTVIPYCAKVAGPDLK